MFGQRLATLCATEHGLGQLLFKQCPLRAVPHHDQAQALVWISLVQGVQARAQQPQVLFRGQAADVQHGDVVHPKPPAVTQRLVASGRIEQAGIDPSGHQFQPLEATALQLYALADAGHQGGCRAPMEPAQVMSEQTRQQAQAILAGVLREIGVKPTDHRNPQPPRCTQGAEPQRAFGGDVQHIRALPTPASQQFVHRHFAPLQAGVAGQGPTAAEQQVLIMLTRRFAGLTRADDLHLMAALAQAFAEAAKGIGHAVDLGWEGFADQGNAQGRCIHDKKCPLESLRSCDGQVTRR
ncbi:hypothetical protein D3C76_625430 [compost metagenome]